MASGLALDIGWPRRVSRYIEELGSWDHAGKWKMLAFKKEQG